MKLLRNKILGHRVDPELVDAYRSAIPHNIQVDIHQNGDTYIATITGVEHQPLPNEVFLITEAKTESELVDKVNDLIFTYKKIPEDYRPFYKQSLKPEGSLANAESLTLVRS